MSDETGKDPVLSSIRDLVRDEPVDDRSAPLVLTSEYQVTTGPLILRNPVFVPPGAGQEPLVLGAEARVEGPPVGATTGQQDLPDDLATKIAALEQAVAAMLQAAPDADAQDGPNSLFEQTADAVMAEQDRLLGHNSGLFAEIDPEKLEPLIRDVLRRDLEGELGERITRNLRQLIQREIRLALSESKRS